MDEHQGPASVAELEVLMPRKPEPTPEQVRQAQTELIGRNIAAIRGELTQAFLADIAHVSRNRVSDWEKGRQRPSDSHLQRLADYFGVTVGWFYDEHPQP